MPSPYIYNEPAGLLPQALLNESWIRSGKTTLRYKISNFLNFILWKFLATGFERFSTKDFDVTVTNIIFSKSNTWKVTDVTTNNIYRPQNFFLFLLKTLSECFLWSSKTTNYFFLDFMFYTSVTTTTNKHTDLIHDSSCLWPWLSWLLLPPAQTENAQQRRQVVNSILAMSILSECQTPHCYYYCFCCAVTIFATTFGLLFLR